MKTIKKIFLTVVLGLISGLFGLQVRADGDTTSLIATRASVAAAIDAEATFTAASYAAFDQILTDQGGLAAIDAMIGAPTSQNDVNAMNFALQDALAKLVSQAAMDLLILRNNLGIAAYYENRSQYTISSHDAFRAAVDAYGGYLTINQRIADPEITPSEVDGLTTVIDAALTLLVDRGDDTVLAAAYDTAFAQDLTPFIPASVTAFSAELSRIYGILIGGDATQAEMDQAVVDLASAEELLIPFADKTALTAAITDTEEIKSEKYTVSSFYVLSSLLTEAIALENHPDALQADVDQMVVDLAATIEELVNMPDEIELTVGVSGIDISSYITLGGSAIVGFSSSDPSVATVDANGLVSPVQFGNATITVTLANGVVENLPIFVKEKVRLLTILLLSGIPLLSVGVGALLITAKTRPVKIAQRVKGNLKKVKKPKKTITLPSDELTKVNKEL